MTGLVGAERVKKNLHEFLSLFCQFPETKENFENTIAWLANIKRSRRLNNFFKAVFEPTVEKNTHSFAGDVIQTAIFVEKDLHTFCLFCYLNSFADLFDFSKKKICLRWLKFNFPLVCNQRKQKKCWLKNFNAETDTCIHYNQRIYLWSFCVIFPLCMPFFVRFFSAVVVGNLRFKGPVFFSGLVDSCARTTTKKCVLGERKNSSS